MSKRNSHAAKAARRAERKKIHAQAAADVAAGLPSVDFHDMDELAELSARGERMACGCDAHDLFGGFLEYLQADLPDGPPQN